MMKDLWALWMRNKLMSEMLLECNGDKLWCLCTDQLYKGQSVWVLLQQSTLQDPPHP